MTIKIALETTGALVFLILIIIAFRYVYVFAATELKNIKIRKLEKEIAYAENPMARIALSMRLSEEERKCYHYPSLEKDGKAVCLFLGFSIFSIILVYIFK